MRLGRRFRKSEPESRDVAKAHFARQAARRERRQKMWAEERRGRRLAQVTLMRRYRVGEMPDIQVCIYSTVLSLLGQTYWQVGRKIFLPFTSATFRSVPATSSSL